MVKEREQQSKIELNVELPPEIKEHARQIYLALSNRDSFEIFCLAARYINASTDSWRKGGFSRKRYYARLRRLVEVGLVQKEGGKYKHSDLGRLVYEIQLKSLEAALGDSRVWEPGRESLEKSGRLIRN